VYRRLLAIGLIAPALLSIPLSNYAWAADVPVQVTQAMLDDLTAKVATALVLLMTPGLAFFYGGFVRGRNVLNTLMMSFILMGLVGTTWVLWGYSLSFAPGIPFIGGLQWLFSNGVGSDVAPYLPHLPYEDALKAADPKYADLGSYAGTIPHQAFMIYQAMFAIITPALISGAIVERISFKAYFWFIFLWSSILYPIFAHMVWAKGGSSDSMVA
jgi:ammonium transporter, Amt family